MELLKIIKRSGQEVEFDPSKIEAAIEKASNTVPVNLQMAPELIHVIAMNVQRTVATCGHTATVEEIQDLVIDEMMNFAAVPGVKRIIKNYVSYRNTREIARQKNTTDDAILSLIERDNEEVKQENSNKNPTVNSVQRDYMAGEVSKDLSMRYLLPQDVVKAHKEGIIHFHDSDYFAQHMHNCCLVNLEDMLQNGTVISGTMIEKPHTFATACNVATQIIAQVASSQYGGQSITLSHLAPFVDISRQRYISEIKEENNETGTEMSEEQILKTAELRVKKEITKGVQTIQYQLITLMTTNGQAPFVSVFMYLNEVADKRTKDDLALIIEEMLKQRIKGVKNEKGHWITPAFPKLLYVTEPDNITPGEKYFYLTELAAKCTAKRMVPDYISEKVMKEYKDNDVYPCMGCRSFLTVDRTQEGEAVGNVAKALNYKNDERKYYGRFNQGVVTINLPDVALSSGGDEKEFWRIFDERLELCHRALRKRHERLLGTPSDVAPILWQYGALARLEKGETIDKLLYHGYSTLSLGYAGLCETVQYMKGVSHTSPEGRPFALEVMQHMNDKCTEWKLAEDIDYSLYGTPLESTTYKFAKALQRRFGIVPGVSDKGYITNSYHVHVTEKIDAFTKLKFESEFQRLSPGGAISYVEVPNMQDNIEALISVIQYMYENIMYAEINTKSDYCQCCGYEGEIQIVESESGKLIWKCPNCGNTDQSKMNVARRTCGYIGTNYWNQGRTQEIKERVLHL